MEENKIKLEIKELQNGRISMLFTSNCGKYGTNEILDCFHFDAEKLLNVLQDNELEENKFVGFLKWYENEGRERYAECTDSSVVNAYINR